MFQPDIHNDTVMMRGFVLEIKAHMITIEQLVTALLRFNKTLKVPLQYKYL